MPFDPIGWAIGYASSKGATALLAKVFDCGAYETILKAAEKWSQDLPKPIRTPAAALFDIDRTDHTAETPSHRQKLKDAILNLHKVPTEEEWYEALLESWLYKKDQLGSDGNAFFQLPRSTAEQHLQELAETIFAACASVLKYSQPLLVKEIREVGLTQNLMLQKIESLISPLNNPPMERNEPISINFDPTHIRERHLHILNEITCVDSPAEVVAGRYRTHEIWIGPDGCSKEDASYVPISAQYVGKRMQSILTEWNDIAVDLAKLDTYQVISTLAGFHHKFLEIHPYPDGNGRVARVILDLQVRNFTLSTASLRLKSYDEYYLALRAADDGDIEHLISLVSDILKNISTNRSNGS